MLYRKREQFHLDGLQHGLTWARIPNLILDQQLHQNIPLSFYFCLFYLLSILDFRIAFIWDRLPNLPFGRKFCREESSSNKWQILLLSIQLVWPTSFFDASNFYQNERSFCFYWISYFWKILIHFWISWILLNEYTKILNCH